MIDGNWWYLIFLRSLLAMLEYAGNVLTIFAGLWLYNRWSAPRSKPNLNPEAKTVPVPGVYREDMLRP